ncbi:MAG: EamA family transporter [Clostridia bacterium]|nr:EamA family transporter [Clostridia bacterium]
MTALLVALMVLLFSFQSLFCKLFSESYHQRNAGIVSAVFSIAYGAFAGIATMFVAGFQFSFSTITLICGIGNAVMLLIYNTAMIQASRSGSYSFQMLCMLYGAIILPMIHEALFMGKSLGAVQLIAIGLMMVSLVLMNLKGLSLKGNSRAFLFWCLLLFFSNGFYSILMNVQQAEMNGAQRNEMIILTFLGMAVLYTVYQLIRDRKALAEGFRIPKKPLLYLLICCISATIAVHLVLYVLTLLENATVLFTIDNGSGVVLSALYSLILFKERIGKVQWAGIALAMVSIIMLSL